MEVKEPIVEEQKGFNFITTIWIVPFIALIIGGWLVYEHYSKLGPEIKIEFKNSYGLTPEQSVVKFRDVPVGKVTRIDINKDKEGVTVYARLHKDVEPFLNETTKFWIVKPNVGYSGVSGLDTLLSGSYIDMYAKKGKKYENEFIGDEHEFVDLGNDLYYTLEANFAVTYKKGTPVYYKGQQVGEVFKIDLDSNNNKVVLVLKIYKKYGFLINETTVFWNQSLFNLKMTGNQVDFNIAPLPILLLGSISFETKLDKKYKSGINKVYTLYKNRADSNRNRARYSEPIIKKVKFKFNNSVDTIDVGMPIDYKNITIGSINKVDTKFNKDTKSFNATCYGEIDISYLGTTHKEAEDNFKAILKDGLSANLVVANPIFNKSIIDLSDKNSTNYKVAFKDGVYIFKTRESKNTDVVALIKDLINKINHLNFDKTVGKINTILDKSKEPIDNLNKILKSAQITLKNINSVISKKDFKNISKNLNSSLKELKSTLNSTQKLLKSYGGNSLFSDKLQDTLKELHNSTEQTNKLLHKLNKKPNALIFGE